MIIGFEESILGLYSAAQAPCSSSAAQGLYSVAQAPYSGAGIVSNSDSHVFNKSLFGEAYLEGCGAPVCALFGILRATGFLEGAQAHGGGT